MVKKLIFDTAKAQFRKALRTHKASVRRNKKTKGFTPIMDYKLLRDKVKRDIKNTKFMDKEAYLKAKKTKSLPKGGPRPRIFGKAYASDKAGKRSMMIQMMTKKERAANQEAISQSVRKFMKERIGRKAQGGVMVKKMLVGGLLTKGIKYGYKQYRKAGGRSIIEIMRSGIRGAGKRSDAKTDVKFGIKMHGGRKLTQRDKNRLR